MNHVPTDADINAFLDAFLSDDAEAANRPEFESLAATVTAAYAESAYLDGHRPAVPRLKPGRESAVLDVIMSRAYPGENLEISLSRLSKAVQTLGFPLITAVSATFAYNTFPHLSEIPYVPKSQRKSRTVHQS